MASPDSSNLPTTYPAPILIGVIGGTGLSSLPNFTIVAQLTLTTPWGNPSSPITVLEHPHPTDPQRKIPVAFLARHGVHHTLAPHEIPSRANIAALRHIGVRTIIAFSAAGSLQEEVKPRDFVVPDQIIDRTKGVRPFTFFESGSVVVHTPFADPFDEGVCKVIRGCGRSLKGEEGSDGVRLHERGTVICMEGPQFSTRAESNMYRSWGGTVINMSVLPEAKLAAEAEIAYAMVVMSTDYDCWHTSGDVTVELVMSHMRANATNARRFIAAILDELSKDEHDDLVHARHLEGMRKGGISTAMEGRDEKGPGMERLRWLFPGYF